MTVAEWVWDSSEHPDAPRPPMQEGDEWVRADGSVVRFEGGEDVIVAPAYR